MDGRRVLLQQRLAIDDTYVPVSTVRYPEPGDPAQLENIRPMLMTLAHGGPFTQWFDKRSAEAALQVSIPNTPLDLVVAIIAAMRRTSKHIDKLDNEFQRTIAQVAVNVQEWTGFSIPMLGQSNAIYCRHFATSVSRAYSELTAKAGRFTKTAVLFVMGVPGCTGLPAFHAWNWLVDFDTGQVFAFEPQNVNSQRPYANASALLYTLAEMRANGAALTGLRRLVRRYDSVHGGMTLFQLARHPIDPASRHAIALRLRAASFGGVVPEWERELEWCDRSWRVGRVNVEDLVRFSDTA